MKNNYKNLIKFLKYYSPYYEDVIISALVKHADEDLTDLMLEKFENGTIEEKIYAAKYFGHIQDPLAYEYLKANSYSENDYLPIIAPQLSVNGKIKKHTILLLQS